MHAELYLFVTGLIEKTKALIVSKEHDHNVWCYLSFALRYLLNIVRKKTKSPLYLSEIPLYSVDILTLKEEKTLSPKPAVAKKFNHSKLLSLVKSDSPNAWSELSKQRVKFPTNPLLAQCFSLYYCEKFEYGEAIRYIDNCLRSHKNWLLYYERGCVKKKAGYLSNDMLDDLLMAAKLTDPKNRAVFFNLINIYWGVKGISHELLSYLSRYQSKFSNYLTASDYMLIASVRAHAGQYTLALRNYDIAKSKDPLIYEKYRSLGLLAYVSHYTKNNELKMYEDVYQHVTTSQTDFIDLLRESNGSFAVIGNGPTELRTSNGKIIDSKKVVIRFNAFCTTSEFQKDYGTKTNIWVRGGHHIDIPRRSTKNLQCIITTGYNSIFRNQTGIDEFFDGYLSQTSISFIPDYVYEALIEKLNLMPSAGLAILYWIYLELGPIPKENIYGFSFGKQPSNKNQHYFNNSKKMQYVTHNWEAEADLLKTIICETN